ncbi:hypothetical protein QJS66_14525 [Kocuria rhizophila]|nr:hypothetical protein QJS66_14525 [Kocuria rhizophila]
MLRFLAGVPTVPTSGSRPWWPPPSSAPATRPRCGPRAVRSHRWRTW